MPLPKAFQIRANPYYFERISLIAGRLKFGTIQGLHIRDVSNDSFLYSIVKKLVDLLRLDQLTMVTLEDKDQSERPMQSGEFPIPSITNRDNHIGKIARMSLLRRSVHRILSKEINVTPFIVLIKQSLSPTDSASRIDMVHTFKDKRELNQD